MGEGVEASGATRACTIHGARARLAGRKEGDPTRVHASTPAPRRICAPAPGPRHASPHDPTRRRLPEAHNDTP